MEITTKFFKESTLLLVWMHYKALSIIKFNFQGNMILFYFFSFIIIQTFLSQKNIKKLEEIWDRWKTSVEALIHGWTVRQIKCLYLQIEQIESTNF